MAKVSNVNALEPISRRVQLRNNIKQSNPRLTPEQVTKHLQEAERLNNTIYASTLDQSNEIFGWEYPVHDGVVI